jgi:hypothetical protein
MRQTHVGLVEPLLALAAILILQLAPAVLPLALNTPALAPAKRRSCWMC